MRSPSKAEEMKPSPLFDAFAVTPDGKVFGKRGRELSGTPNTYGYVQVQAIVDGKRKSFLAHRLVAAAYCEGYAPGLQVNHKNGIKTDNRADNLEWVTAKQNTSHATGIGLRKMIGAAHTGSKITDDDVLGIIAMVRGGAKLRGVAAKFGISLASVSLIANGKSWKHIQRNPSNELDNKVECMAERNIDPLQQTKKLRGA